MFADEMGARYYNTYYVMTLTESRPIAMRNTRSGRIVWPQGADLRCRFVAYTRLAVSRCRWQLHPRASRIYDPESKRDLENDLAEC